MKFNEYLKTINDKEISNNCRLLVGLLHEEFNLNYEYLMEHSEDEIIKKYAITGELNCYNKDNSEINYLRACKKVLSMSPDDMRENGAFDVLDLIKSYPSRKGIGFYKDCLKALKTKDIDFYHKIDEKAANIIKKEKENRVPQSSFSKRISEFCSGITKISFWAVAGAMANSIFLGQAPVNPSVIFPVSAIAAGSVAISYASEIKDRIHDHNKAVSDALCKSVVYRIVQKDKNDPLKHPYIEADSIGKLKSEILDINEEINKYKDIKNDYMRDLR